MTGHSRGSVTQLRSWIIEEGNPMTAIPAHLSLSVLSIALFVLAACGPEQPQTRKAVTHSANDAALTWGPCPAIFPAGCEIAVLNGDPAKPNADVFLRVPGQYEIPAHSHTSAERMILVTGELLVTYDRHAPSTLRAGSYAYGPAKLAHKASCVSAEPCTLFIAFEQAVDAEPHAAVLAGP
jgi:mannose-6-phosphate isomerase-like protein (cupin superfamily)